MDSETKAYAVRFVFAIECTIFQKKKWVISPIKRGIFTVQAKSSAIPAEIVAILGKEVAY